MTPEQRHEATRSERIAGLWWRWYESGPNDHQRGWWRDGDEGRELVIISRDDVRWLCDRISEELCDA